MNTDADLPLLSLLNEYVCLLRMAALDKYLPGPVSGMLNESSLYLLMNPPLPIWIISDLTFDFVFALEILKLRCANFLDTSNLF